MKNKQKILIIYISLLLIIPLMILNVSSSSITNNGASVEEVSLEYALYSWTSIGNSKISDNSYSTVNFKSGTTNYIYIYNFGFSSFINAGDTLNGIIVTIEKKSSVVDRLKDNIVSLGIYGSPSGDNKATSTYYTTTDTEVNYGSSSDKWNFATTSYVRESSFGVFLSVISDSVYSSIASIDCIKITVYYTTLNPNPPSNLIVSPVVSSTSSLSISFTKGLGGDYTRVQYKTGSNPTTINDGTNGYNNTGTYFTQTGLTSNERYYFSAWSFNVTYKTWSLTYVSNNARVYAVPLKPSLFIGGFDSNNLYDIIAWEKGINATYTRIQYNTGSYPTSISSGTNLCNITGNHSYLVNSGSVLYYFSAWSWNTTTKLWSNDYKTVLVSIPSVCGSTDLIFYNNTHNTSGKYETNYNSVTGWKVWSNFTGITTPLHIFENIGNAFGIHTHILNSTGYWIHANYTSALTKGNNIVNTTGTHESYYDSIGNTWRIWANYTGDTTPIELIDNSINVTGNYDYEFNYSGYHVFCNYTGLSGGSCPDILNLYLFENIFNVTGNHTYYLNDTGYVVYANYSGNNSFDGNTSEFWLYLGSTLTLDNFMLLLIYLFSIMYFIFNNKTNELFLRTKAHYIFILFTIVLLFGVEVGAFIVDLNMSPLERAMLSPFIIVFIILLWLVRRE